VVQLKKEESWDKMTYSEEYLYDMLKKAVEHYKEKMDQHMKIELFSIFLSTDAKVFAFKTVKDFMGFEMEDYYGTTIDMNYSEEIRDKMDGMIAGYGYHYTKSKIGKNALLNTLEVLDPGILTYTKDRKRAEMYAYKMVLRKECYDMAIEMYREFLKAPFSAIIAEGSNDPDFQKKWQKEKLRRIL